MENLNTKKVIEVLNTIVQCELSGVVRYTHYALMITGRDRLTLTEYFKTQASESLTHAQEAGELVTGLGGHPSLEISIIEESNKHKAIDLLNERYLDINKYLNKIINLNEFKPYFKR